MALFKQISYHEWRRISDTLPVKGFNFDMQGTPKGYVSYDYEMNWAIYFVPDPDAERLCRLGQVVLDKVRLGLFVDLCRDFPEQSAISLLEQVFPEAVAAAQKGGQ